MVAVKVGQIWRDKDKRRDRTVEVTHVDAADNGVTVEDAETGKVSVLKLDRFEARWELVDFSDLAVQVDPETGVAAVKLSKVEHTTREGWLQAAVGLITEHIFGETENLPEDFEIPEVRVSVGWPGGRGPKSNTIGQCWHSGSTGDKLNQIFISPVLDQAVNVLCTLTHELIHASDDGASKHRGHFAKVAAAVGFKAPFTSSQVDGEPNANEELVEGLKNIAAELGDYPHSKISLAERPIVQKTYMVKLGPNEDCIECDPDYKIRMTEKWIEEVGAPLCPHGLTMEVQ